MTEKKKKALPLAMLMQVIPSSAKQASGNIKSDEPKPSATKQCKIMLPLKKNEYSVPSHSSDRGSRDPSAPKGKDGPAAEQEGGQDSASKEEAQDASPDLQKKKGRGRPRKNALNDNQQKGSVDTTSDENVTSGSASQKNSEKTAELASPAHPIEASDSGLGIDVSQSGSGLVTDEVQNTAKPLEEASQQAVEQSKVGTDEATDAGSQLEPPKKKGRSRPRKSPVVSQGPPAESTDVGPTESVGVTASTESVQATASVDSVQAKALSDCVQAAVPTDSVQAAASSTESSHTASLQSASEVDDVAPQSEPPKKKGRGRLPRKTPVVTHPKSSSVEETKESDTGANREPSDSMECEPPEKKAKPEEMGSSDLVGGSEAVNSSVRSLQEEGQAEPHQSPIETAQLVSPPECSKAPAMVEDALADASKGGPPEKEAKEADDQVMDSSKADVPFKSSQKRGRGRPRKNVASTETAVQPPGRDEEKAVEYDSTDASMEEPKQKRGRGRPPGPKRGRGRPRKNPAGNYLLNARCQFYFPFLPPSPPFFPLLNSNRLTRIFMYKN